MEEYDALSPKERKEVERPKHTRVRIEDATPEAVQPIMRDSPNGVLLVRDELSGWFGMIDKYSGRGGGGADRGFWLSAFNGGLYTWDRVGRGSGVIENLSISMLGGIQEDLLRKLAMDGTDDGLLQRINPIILRGAVMGRDEQSSQDRYDDLVTQLHTKLPDFFNEMQFDDDALEIRKNLEQDHINLVDGYMAVNNRKLASHLGKYNGTFARLSLLWHCIENVNERWPSNISAKTAQRAADFLHKFMLPHARAFYVGVMGNSDIHDRLLSVAGYILARGLERITNRDVQRGDNTMRGLNPREIENVFSHLDACNWISKVQGKRFNEVHWIVNPEVHRRFATRAKEEAERRATVWKAIIESEDTARRREEKTAKRGSGSV
jgi:hypothetical protein